MRAISEQEEMVLNAPDGHSVWVRVLVWDGASYQDVTKLEGRNWLVSVEWDESVNEPCAQATVTLRRRLEDYSLNPLISNKLTGLLTLKRPFIIETATVPLGDPAVDEDYREVFTGEVETLALEKDPITFTGRDNAGRLLRAYIETEREYGSAAGVPVETIIQSILTDNGTGVTLYVPAPTGAKFRVFQQKKAPVLTAVRELALRIGWDLRYLWDDGTGGFRFTLYKPNRTATAADSEWTFQPHKVKDITKLGQTLFDVRNVGKLYFFNRLLLDASGKPTLDDVTTEDAASIAAYDRQYIQFAEDEDSPIDSPSEAQTMLDSAIADLKEPLLDFGVDVGYHYAVQLGDMLTFAGDELHFSSAQTLAVVSAAHRIDGRGHRTSLQLRGKPVGANDAWLARDGRVRVASQPPASAPAPVSALTAAPTAGGAVLTFAEPTVPPYPVEHELHLSTVSGFTPSEATFKEKSSTTAFTRDDLTPGVTYYAKVVSRDKVGNRSEAAEISFVPRYVEPRALQPRVAYGALPPNSDFEAQNSSTGPDLWTVASGAWGSTVLATNDSFSGGSATRVMAGTSATLLSQLMSVRPGTTYCVRAFIRATGAASSIGSLGVKWYSTAGGTGSPYIETYGATGGVWTEVRVFDTAPSTAKYAEVIVSTSSTSTVDIYVDSVEFLPTSIPQRPWRLVGPSIGGGFSVAFESGWSNIGSPFETVGFRINTLGNLELKGLARAPSPGPAAYANVFTLSTGFRPAAKKLFRVNTSSGPADIEIETTGAVKLQAIGASGYLPLDGLSFPMG